MKKFTLLALAALTMAPASMSAASWEKTVTNADEVKAAFNAIGTGAEGETYTIICDWDAATLVNVGKQKPKMTKGTLIIKSNQTEFAKMPQLELAFEWQSDCVAGEIGKRMSVIIENMNIKGNGSYLIDNRRDVWADTIALRNCDIHDQVRSILRFDADRGTHQTNSDGSIKSGEGAGILNIDVIEVTNCKIHGTAQGYGDNWAVFRTFFPVNNFIVKDCMFYDMPWAKTLWETRWPGQKATVANFSNNLVLAGENKGVYVTYEKDGEMKTTRHAFTVLNPGGKLGAGATLYMYNNVIMAPQKGQHTLVTDSCTYENTKVLSIANATVYANNNVVDATSYMTLEDNAAQLEANGVSITADFFGTPLPGGNTLLADYSWFSWETGATFQEPEKDVYNMLKTNPWATSGGFYDDMSMYGATYIGPSIAYVDVFPVKAAVSVNVVGPSYCSYTVSPDKAVYYIGDEITITANGHNTMYRDFTTFKGWSDGDMNETRTITLDGDLNLTATYEQNLNVATAFDFSNLPAKNTTVSSHAAEIYRDMDAAYQGVAYGVSADTVTTKVAPFPMIAGTFQTRTAKFGEDVVDMQMPVISRRTAAVAKYDTRDYVVIAFSTKGLKGLKFSAYVGTDSNAAKVQKAQWSTDSLAWNDLTQVEIVNGIWSELKADLPGGMEDQDKVYIRIYGDHTSELIYTEDPAGGFVDEVTMELIEENLRAQDCFEYLGNILITTTTASGITNVVAGNDAAINPNAPFYNLMGMKVAKGTKGLLIQNGKKVIVK